MNSGLYKYTDNVNQCFGSLFLMNIDFTFYNKYLVFLIFLRGSLYSIPFFYYLYVLFYSGEHDISSSEWVRCSKVCRRGQRGEATYSYGTKSDGRQTTRRTNRRDTRGDDGYVRSGLTLHSQHNFEATTYISMNVVSFWSEQVFNYSALWIMIFTRRVTQHCVFDNVTC